LAIPSVPSVRDGRRRTNPRKLAGDCLTPSPWSAPTLRRAAATGPSPAWSGMTSNDAGATDLSWRWSAAQSRPGSWSLDSSGVPRKQ
jgi:hypothetical protein